MFDMFQRYVEFGICKPLIVRIQGVERFFALSDHIEKPLMLHTTYCDLLGATGSMYRNYLL